MKVKIKTHGKGKKNQIGKGIDIHKLIGKLPRPKRGWVLPNHKYTGPYNPLEKQIDPKTKKPLKGQEPYNKVDAIALQHDICYDEGKSKSQCDKNMLVSLKKLKNINFRERLDKFLVESIIGTKYRLGF